MGNFNYYQNQLDSLDVKNAEYPATVKIRADSKSTNFISLNDESANLISKWLNENYKIDSEKKTEISNV